MAKIKLKKVNQFAKSAGTFIIEFYSPGKPMGGGVVSNCPLTFGFDGKPICSIAWEMDFGVFLGTTKHNGPIDLSVIRNAKPVAKGQDVKTNLEGDGVGYYDREKDVVMEKQGKSVTDSIDLGKGVYMLLNHGEYIGVLVKGAKKKYDSLVDSVEGRLK